jgi:hypothetical protein
MAFYTYAPQTISPDGKFHRTHDTMRTHHITGYTQDQVTRRKYLGMLKNQQALAPNADKGKTKPQGSEPYDVKSEVVDGIPTMRDISEARTPDEAKLIEYANVAAMQARFHRRRAEHHLEMAYRHGLEALESIQEPAPPVGTDTADLSPSMFGRVQVPHGMDRMIEYHNTLQGDAMRLAGRCMSERDSMTPPDPNDPIDDWNRFGEARRVLEMTHEHLLGLSEMSADLLTGAKDWMKRKADATPYRDAPDDYDPEVGVGGKPSNVDPASPVSVGSPAD